MLVVDWTMRLILELIQAKGKFGKGRDKGLLVIASDEMSPGADRL